VVRVRSAVIGPTIAHSVLPPRVESLEINGEEGQVPVSKLLLPPPSLLPSLGGDNGPSSPGEAILVSPPPHEAIMKIEKIKNKFLDDFRFIRIPLKKINADI
jgi:hypothetical protein